MVPGHKRGDFQVVAQAKLDDALLLLEHGKFSNAYYLSGYAVEIGLKACIAKQFAAEVIPDRNFVTAIYKHSFEDLIGSAGLSAQLTEGEDRDSVFAANFAIATQWNPEVRYKMVDPASARRMVSAIADASSGVFQWINAFW